MPRYTIAPGHRIERDGQPFLTLSHTDADGNSSTDARTTAYIARMLNVAEDITETTKGYLKS